ncbi:MAG TPA: oxidative damage protection protein [Gammaproteobacteria bacterium]|jgi:Fe-S cluster biosynthesis and repair protein YggX|nr:oxidative damage protection protein [Gammaproteobacteria bacterium]
MTKRIIYCTKLKREAEGLVQPPVPGALGQRIYAEISKEAWASWQQHQTMLINEYRLSMIDPKARQYLLAEMEKFLFGDGSEKPAGFVPKD